MTTPDEVLSTCSCGYTPDHPFVEARGDYGFLGWFALLNGASATPKRLTYRCRRCGESLGTTRDPEALRKHV